MCEVWKLIMDYLDGNISKNYILYEMCFRHAICSCDTIFTIV